MHPFLDGLDVGFDAGRSLLGYQRARTLSLLLSDQGEHTRHPQHHHPNDQRRQPWRESGGQSQNQGGDQHCAAVEGQHTSSTEQAGTDAQALALLLQFSGG